MGNNLAEIIQRQRGLPTLQNVAAGRSARDEESEIGREVDQEEFMDVHVNNTHYRVQRFCPHRGVDLKKYGVVNEDGSITCTAHNLCFDLDTGECRVGRKGRYLLKSERKSL